MTGPEAVLPGDDLMPTELPVEARHAPAGGSLADELFDAIGALDADDVAATMPVAFRLNGPDRAFVTVRPHRAISVGRQPPAAGDHDALDVAHPLVSRRHVQVRLDDGRLFADELGSRNGSVIRRRGATLAVDGTVELFVGDQVATVNGIVLFDVAAGTSP